MDHQPQTRFDTAQSTKINNWLMTQPDVATLSNPKLAKLASAALGLEIKPGHIHYRLECLREAGDLPPKSQPTTPPAEPANAQLPAEPAPELPVQLKLVKDEAAREESQEEKALQASAIELWCRLLATVERQTDRLRADLAELDALADLLDTAGRAPRQQLALLKIVEDNLSHRAARTLSLAAATITTASAKALNKAALP